MTEPIMVASWIVKPDLNRLVDSSGHEITVEPKIMQVLMILINRPGEVVTRDQFFEQVWGGEHVTEHSLSRSISELRRTLGDDPAAPTYIETIRKGGYRLLVQPIRTSLGSDAAPSRNSAARWQRPLSILMVIAILSIAIPVLGLLLLNDRTMTRIEPHLKQTPLTTFPGIELDPSLSPDGNAVAFSWNGRDRDNFDIYIKTIGEEVPVRLTTDSAEDKNPVWSPDGTMIAFVRSRGDGGEIRLIPVLGGGERKMIDTRSGDIVDISWIGEAIYFADESGSGTPTAIHRVDVRTLVRERLTHPPAGAFGDRDLAVSRDGSRVAFARATVPGVEDLYVLDIRSGREAKLTNDGSPINGLDWSGDGRSIIFASARDGSTSLWTIDASGGEPRSMSQLGEFAFDPSVSRDGTKIAFERKRLDTNIWRATPSSSIPRMIAGSTRWDSEVAVSRDGDQIAFISDRGGEASLWIAASDGTNPRTLNTGQSDGAVRGRPLWSRDGSTILFGLGSGNSTAIWSVDTDGRRAARVTPAGWDAAFPSWFRNGESILFSSSHGGSWQIWEIALGGNGPRRIHGLDGVRAIAAENGQSIFFTQRDRPGIWRYDIGSGATERMLIDHVTPSPVDWDVTRSAIWFRPLSTNPAELQPLYRLDLVDGSLDAVTEPMSGMQFDGGLDVSDDDELLFFGRLELDDGDIVLAEIS